MLCGLCDMYFDTKSLVAQNDIREQLDKISDNKVPALVDIFSKGAELGSTELVKQLQDHNVHLTDQLADVVTKNFVFCD